LKIIIMGAGGVGGYYGGLLAHAGHDVTFVARGAHLEAMRSNGLHIKSVHGDLHLKPVQATDDPAEAGGADWILVCVKTRDTDHAAEMLRPLVGPQTIVTSLQNGIDAAERIGAVVGMEHVVGGATWISSAVEAPGVIRQVSAFRRVVLGELDGTLTQRTQTLVHTLAETGVAAELAPDIRQVLWTKFLFIAVISGVGSLTRLPIGAYRGMPETRALLVSLMHEVQAVARADGVTLAPDVVESTLALIDGAAADIVPSMQRDVMAGSPSELESLIGVMGRKGRELGVPTPAADVVYAALLPVECKARK
jgi:2-dehydropantoate 2-reductase